MARGPQSKRARRRRKAHDRRVAAAPPPPPRAHVRFSAVSIEAIGVGVALGAVLAPLLGALAGAFSEPSPPPPAREKGCTCPAWGPEGSASPTCPLHSPFERYGAPPREVRATVVSSRNVGPPLLPPAPSSNRPPDEGGRG